MPTRRSEAQEIPAGRAARKVIGAAITAGTAPAWSSNTAPAAVRTVPAPRWPGRPEQVPDGMSYIEDAAVMSPSGTRGRTAATPAALEPTR
jgi:multiple sugar transport system substrate-binding protein